MTPKPEAPAPAPELVKVRRYSRLFVWTMIAAWLLTLAPMIYRLGTLPLALLAIVFGVLAFWSTFGVPNMGSLRIMLGMGGSRRGGVRPHGNRVARDRAASGQARLMHPHCAHSAGGTRVSGGLSRCGEGSVRDRASLAGARFRAGRAMRVTATSAPRPSSTPIMTAAMRGCGPTTASVPGPIAPRATLETAPTDTATRTTPMPIAGSARTPCPIRLRRITVTMAPNAPMARGTHASAPPAACGRVGQQRHRRNGRRGRLRRGRDDPAEDVARPAQPRHGPHDERGCIQGLEEGQRNPARGVDAEGRRGFSHQVPSTHRGDHEREGR